MDTRSFHRHGRDIGFPCLLEYLGDVDNRSFHRHGRDTSFPCLLEYLGDLDMRSFHRHGRDMGFPCLLGYLSDVDKRSFHRHRRDTGFPCLLEYLCDPPKPRVSVDYPSTCEKSIRLVLLDPYLSKNGHLGPCINTHQTYTQLYSNNPRVISLLLIQIHI